eukprot:283446-Rhodomonas_salina.1
MPRSRALSAFLSRSVLTRPLFSSALLSSLFSISSLCVYPCLTPPLPQRIIQQSYWLARSAVGWNQDRKGASSSTL